MYIPPPYVSAIDDRAKDDTTAIQTAIDMLPVGGILFLPSKKFRTTSKLRIDKEFALSARKPKFIVIILRLELLSITLAVY